MPLTVEHIVSCHAAAAELRKAGNPIWSRKVNIKTILSEDPTNKSPEHAASVANRIGALLRAKLPAELLDFNESAYDFHIAEIVESMEQLKATDYCDDGSYTPLDDLNDRLSELYDWADVSRVWLGS